MVKKCKFCKKRLGSEKQCQLKTHCDDLCRRAYNVSKTLNPYWLSKEDKLIIKWKQKVSELRLEGLLYLTICSITDLNFDDVWYLLEIA